MTEQRTFVLVDGENIDATIGNSLLNRRPTPEERPRWERVTAYVEQLWGQPATGLFFLNATSGQLHTPFIQALLAMNYRRSRSPGAATRRSSTSASSAPSRPCSRSTAT